MTPCRFTYHLTISSLRLVTLTKRLTFPTQLPNSVLRRGRIHQSSSCSPASPFAARAWLTAWTKCAISALFTVAVASITAPFSRNYQINQIVDRVKRSEVLAVQSSPSVGESLVRLEAIDKLGNAAQALRLVTEQLKKSDTDRYCFNTATRLGHFFREFDYRIAHTLFEIARSLTSKNPVENARSAWYGELTWYFAELEDYKSARETAKRADSLVLDGVPDRPKYAGMLGGYAAIIDAESLVASHLGPRGLG